MTVPFIETGTTTTGTTTVADLINDTRRHLDTGEIDPLNRFSTAVDPAVTTFTFTHDLGGIQDGAVIAVGLECMYVWTVNETGHTAVVERGFLGSTASSHTTLELVRVNPRWSDFHILRALNADLHSLSGAGLYRVKTVDVTSDGTARTYDLASDVVELLEVRWDSSASANHWPLLEGCEVLHNQPTNEFPSGKALRISRVPEAQRSMRVVYKADLAASLDALDDDVQTVTGLLPTAHDIPPLGAAARLAVARDIRRTDTWAQGDTRRADEVGTGSPRQATLGLDRLRATRIGEERARLDRVYYYVRRTR